MTNSGLQATQKSSQMDMLLSMFSGKDRVDAVAEGYCATCNRHDEKMDITVKSFRDQQSIDEYMISGMCQECQDDIFGDEE